MTLYSRRNSSGNRPESDAFEQELFADPPDLAQNEAEEMELAAQLLEITNEAGLEHFVGTLLQRAARSAGRALSAPVLGPLAGALKATLKHALPILGGGTLGADAREESERLTAAGRTFGLDLEGLNPDDQEFELARRFVRLTRAAGRRASRFARVMPPRRAVRRSLVSAARRHAPGLLRRRRRRRAARIMVPLPVYPVPVPMPPPEPDPDASADTDPPPGDNPDADPADDSNGNVDTAAEPATEAAPGGAASCHCGGTCVRCRSRESGRWVRAGHRIILQDV